MHTNGLESYFKRHNDGHGQLIVDNKFKSVEMDILCLADLYELSGYGNFFVKPSNKIITDAEVLLSQLYASAGFNTAIYLPAVDMFTLNSEGSLNLREGLTTAKLSAEEILLPFVKKLKNNAVISNDVSRGRVPSSVVFRELGLFQGSALNLVLDDYGLYTDGDFTSCLMATMTPKVQEDFVKMHLFDLATCNKDRHAGNYYMTFEDGVVKDIALIDYGDGHKIMFDPCVKEKLLYSCCFGERNLLTESQLLEELKTNENVQSCFSNAEMAEMLGNTDVQAVADDIQTTIGYEVDSKYVDAVAKRIDNVAEQLLK